MATQQKPLRGEILSTNGTGTDTVLGIKGTREQQHKKLIQYSNFLFSNFAKSYIGFETSKLFRLTHSSPANEHWKSSSDNEADHLRQSELAYITQ